MSIHYCAIPLPSLRKCRGAPVYQLFAFFNSQDEPTLAVGGANPTAPPGKGRMGKGRGGVTTMVLKERSTPRATHILKGGDFTRPGAKVGPGTPAVLPPLVPPGANAP